MEERERKLAALDAAIERGMSDPRDGRVQDAEQVFGALEAELEALPERSAA